MARITIIKPDNAVYVDGAARYVNCATLPEDVLVLQFDTVKGVGHIEFDNTDLSGDDYKPNQTIDANHFAVFQPWVDAWQNAGQDPVSPANPGPAVLTCSPRQLRLALNQLGLRDAVEAYVAAASQDVKDSWEYTTEFTRTHPLLVAAGAGLGKTEQEIDALFQLARAL